MADRDATLMQGGHARRPPAVAGSEVSPRADPESRPGARDARYDAIVRMLRARDADDRDARDRRQRGYRQSLDDDARRDDTASPPAPARLHRLPTKVPCLTTPEARALLDELRRHVPGGTVTFPQLASGRQAVMISRGAGAEPRQIGWVEHCVESDPARCNVRHQGLSVETDGGRMLVLRFRYPPTAVRMASRDEAAPEPPAPRPRCTDGQPTSHDGDDLELPSSGSDEVARVDFTELRPALDLRPPERGPSPRLVWVTRPEAETLDALRSREYEAFYARFKLEVLAGIWSSLSSLLASAPGSLRHGGACYAVVRQPDAANGRIHERTVDDSGRTVDVGRDRTYDAAPATDILLLHLDGDILADVADIYFTLHSLDSADAYALKEEFFRVIRRFWASSHSLAWRYGSDLPTVVRMSQRVLPMPYQSPLLKQDWTKLRQSMIDRYGEGGREAASLAAEAVRRPRGAAGGWPFASFPAGEVNVGLRVVHRQEWKRVGAQRGAVLRTVAGRQPANGESDVAASATATPRAPSERRIVDTTVAPGDATRTPDQIVHAATDATLGVTRWRRGADGCIDTGARALGASTDMGLEAECRESSRDASARLGDVMCRMARRTREAMVAVPSAELAERDGSSTPADVESPGERDDVSYVYSRLQHRYEITTRVAEIENVVLVAEKLPAPAEIDRAWVRRHDWILAKVLLDESFRDALDTIGRDGAAERDAEREGEREAKRERLYEHVRINILHYQRAIWQHEDPQQRSLRYRKWGKRVPLEWRFEVAWGAALTIDELRDRLTAPNVDGQFAAYSAGREADLDQLIDPAGPIGFHGNYAVYHMRPELASAELFSMLHFFKSPYLRPHPETGAPEVCDPAQIQLAEELAEAPASDRAIERHRDEMFRCVPELRLELARTRTQVSDGTDPSAVDRLERQTSALKRHFAAYLFRRERTRRLALDTDGVVIDVVRRVDAAAGEAERDDGAMEPVAASEERQALVLDGDRGIALLTTRGYRDAASAWTMERAGDARLVAGRPHQPRGAATVAARDDAPSAMAAAGGTGATHALELVPAPGDGALHLRAAAAPASGPAPAIRARAHDRSAPDVRAAGAPSSGPVPEIRARDGDATAPALRAGRSRPAAAAAAIRAGVIPAGEGDASTAGLRTGRAHDPAAEGPIVAGVDGESRLAVSAGAGAAHTPPPAMLAPGGDGRTVGVGRGRAQERDPEPMIAARDEGARLPALRWGQLGAPGAERMVVARDDAWARLVAAAGARGPGTAIVAIDEKGTPNLLVGASAGRSHAQVIPARDYKWLRPSLVAG